MDIKLQCLRVIVSSLDIEYGAKEKYFAFISLYKIKMHCRFNELENYTIYGISNWNCSLIPLVYMKSIRSTLWLRSSPMRALTTRCMADFYRLGLVNFLKST